MPRQIRHFDVTPEIVLHAYCAGIFPMATGWRGRLQWFSPDLRAILPLHPPEAFHIPHGLRRRLKQNPFTITFDRAFADVIRACAQPRAREPETWISNEIVNLYVRLHDMGFAHSVEAWVTAPEPAAHPAYDAPHGAVGVVENTRQVLAGGLYGVAIGGAFFGESMFTRISDASKVCLVRLIEHLRSNGYQLLDVQFVNPHLKQFGVQEISRDEYLQRLAAAVELPVRW